MRVNEIIGRLFFNKSIGGITMSQAINYRTTRYHHIGKDELYIDHRQKRTYWTKLKDKFLKSAQNLDARFRDMFSDRTSTVDRKRAIRQQLRDVGLNSIDMLKPETFYVTKLLHKNENILGAIVGHVDGGGNALMLVTSLRVIYLNQIPLFTNVEELGYGIVDGISSNVGRIDATITVHTGIGHFTLHSVNIRAATIFANAIEKVSVDERSIE